jgi:hypothetical protein
MTKALLAIGAAAVALSAMPADAQSRHHGRHCTKWRHGHCVSYRNFPRHSDRFRVGYRFGPRYAYTPFGSIPRTYVSRYSLRPRYRYVYRDDVIYVVDPRTYAVVRVIVR